MKNNNVYTTDGKLLMDDLKRMGSKMRGDDNAQRM